MRGWARYRWPVFLVAMYLGFVGIFSLMHAAGAELWKNPWVSALPPIVGIAIGLAVSRAFFKRRKK